MARYILYRAFHSLIALVVLLIAIFFASRVIGDPTLVMLPVDASESARQQLRQALGLGEPILLQLLAFGERALFEAFGQSFRQGRPVMLIIAERLPNTGLLALAALLISVPPAIALGSLAALRPRSVEDRVINVLSLGGVSVVDFWLGLMLILAFGVWLGILPTGGSGGLAHLVLPAVTLSFRTTGRVAQFTRSAMMDEYVKPYVKTARAKGMSERRVFLHALKNAAVPLLTLAGDETNSLVNGSLVVETVFAWPGIGLLVIQAIESRDLMLIEGAVFVLALFVIVINLTVDLTYTYLNPRIRYDTKVSA
jgi:peptide/nickel transport system permease protein